MRHQPFALHRLSRRAITALTVAVVTCGAAVALSDPAVAAPPGQPSVLLRGLNNPRQLSLVGDRELLVAEAGAGGSTQVGSGDEAEYVGTTGSITAVWDPQHGTDRDVHRIITGLLSGAGSPDGTAAVGPDGVSARWGSGRVYIQETYAPPDVLPTQVPAVQVGKLLAAYPFGTPRVVADISGYEQRHDPDGKGFDSNPYAVLALPDGTELVADAAGNDVLRVDRWGRISLFHTFANVTTGACADQADPSPAFPGCNYVPTSLATDRWGNVFVGGLVSEAPGQGRVTELDRWGNVRHVWGGFTSVTGVALGPDGSLYVSQLEAAEAHPAAPMITGVLTRIDCRGRRTNIDVPFPAGVAVDRRNTVFVSAFSIATAAGLGAPGSSGQVWRLRF